MRNEFQSWGWRISTWECYGFLCKEENLKFKKGIKGWLLH